MSSHKTNITRIKSIANALENLNEHVVYVGGAVVSLYLENPELASIRVTDDVDVVVQMETQGQYIKLQEKLRSLGFKEDVESGVICRWTLEGTIVDVMPDNPDILGFSNRWYAKGIQEKIICKIDENISINIFPPAYFIASKIEAMYGRPEKYDWRWSQDFEDILKVSHEVNLLDHDIDEELKKYFKEHFTIITKDISILEEAIAAHLIPPFYTDEDVEIISQRFLDYAKEF